MICVYPELVSRAEKYARVLTVFYRIAGKINLFFLHVAK